MSFNRSNKTMYTMYNTSQSLYYHGPSWTQNYFGPPGTIKDSLRPSQTILNHVGPSTNCLRSYWIIWDQLGQSETILNHLSLGLVPFLTSPDWMVGWLSPAGRRYRAPYSANKSSQLRIHIYQCSVYLLSFDILLLKVFDKDQRILSLYLCELPPKLVQYLRNANHHVKRHSSFAWIWHE